MAKITKPRGTEDLLFIDTYKWNMVETIMRETARKYNFQEIRTPYFESTDLFVRGVGETTDVVTKEMYTFDDKKGRSLSLRPEGTTGAIRAYIENKMYADLVQPIKLFYLGAMFRYERPQKGRQRQFHQFGVETLGIKSPQVDTEVIMLGLDICEKLGLKNLKVLINTLGDNESRLRYRTDLIAYFKQHTADLCSDCQTRLEKNPLRLLDCKVDREKDFVVNAPKLRDYLNDDARAYFDEVLSILTDLNVSYEIDDNLVRGLDYYTDTIFEIVSTNEASGAQATLFGGGRYDGLVASLGGPDVSGIGFGMGIERMMISIEAENPGFFKKDALDVFIMPLSDTVRTYAFKVLERLRSKNLNADMEYFNKSLKAMLRQAERENVRYVIIIGEDEMAKDVIILKDLENNTQEELSEQWLEIVYERVNKNAKNS